VTDEDLRRLFEETRQQIDSSASETRGYVDEMRRHFDVRFEDIETRFDALAEGVQLLDEKVDRGNSDIRDEMRRGFAETHAMIKFSHVELDRRVLALEHGHRTLEDKVERLEERVDRIDSSTH
jgi:predicted  nucleic acid-binding Zn-ribbon protein